MDVISIIISSLNERAWLIRTIASIYHSTKVDYEIVVVDDASNDGTSSADFNQYSLVKYHRNRERIGLIRSRVLGTTMATGNYLVFMDAHCKPEAGWDTHLLVASKDFQDRIIAVPAVPVVDVTAWVNDFRQTGYAMAFNKRMDMKWCRKPVLDGRVIYMESPIFAGCACLISKAFYEELQGFDEGLTLWGGENIDLSLRCWMLGGKIVIVQKAIVGHMFKPNFTYSLSKETIIANKIRVAAVNFSSERLQRVMNNLRVNQFFPEQPVPEPGQIASRRNYLVQNRIYDDNWFMDKFNIEV